MSTTIANLGGQAATAERSNPSYQAYQILHLGFTVAPILAGIDKFFHLLCNWDQYLAPWMAALSPIGGHSLMLVASSGHNRSRSGSTGGGQAATGRPIVGLWLCLIIVNLLTMAAYLDVALRDLGLALGAFALWRLAQQFDR